MLHISFSSFLCLLRMVCPSRPVHCFIWEAQLILQIYNQSEIRLEGHLHLIQITLRLLTLALSWYLTLGSIWGGSEHVKMIGTGENQGWEAMTRMSMSLLNSYIGILTPGWLEGGALGRIDCEIHSWKRLMLIKDVQWLSLSTSLGEEAVRNLKSFILQNGGLDSRSKSWLLIWAV